MASSALAANPSPPAMDRLEPAMDRLELDAARALLGVSPGLPLSGPEDNRGSKSWPAGADDGAARTGAGRPCQAAAQVTTHFEARESRSEGSLSDGLNALAALASREQAVSGDDSLDRHVVATGVASTSSFSSASPSHSSDEDSESMPPPPPRRRRHRSASNPEGMEKWDSLNGQANSRRHFVLPASIIEEELAEVNAAVLEQQQRRQKRTRRKEPRREVIASPERQQHEHYQQQLPALQQQEPGQLRQQQQEPESLQQQQQEQEPESLQQQEEKPVAAHSAPAREPEAAEKMEQETTPSKAEQDEEPAVDDSDLTPDELLRKARSRLLEDLSEGSVTGEKGALTLPHSLSKYKEVYNKNGRIGIYTPAERAAIIARFNQKRARRVWNKKIRYNCRKSLADRRLRVKGRFVKRSEQEQLAKQLQRAEEGQMMEAPTQVMSSNPAISPAAPAAAEVTSSEGSDATKDEDMPDVSDPEAGFAPTEEQPYRRVRRHTIT